MPNAIGMEPSYDTSLRSTNPWWAEPSRRPRRVQPRRRRAHFQRLFDAATRADGRSLVMVGPRRVGKTELLLQVADALLREAGVPPERLLYVDLSDPLFARTGGGSAILEQVLAAWPGAAAEGPRVALIDELQAVEGWEVWLKHTLDWRPGLRVLAAGSSSLRLFGGGRESGRGRWDDLVIEGLTYIERLELLADDPTESIERVHARRPQRFREHLELGGLPEYLDRFEDRAQSRRHMRAEVDREIAAELAGVVGNVDAARRLFLLFAQSSGQQHQISKLAGEVALDTQTLARHIECLADMLLIQRLQPFPVNPDGEVRSQKARLASHKVYVAEPGHVAAFSPLASPLENSGLAGQLYETAVFHALRAARRDLDWTDLGYLRRDGGEEVDFVLMLPAGPVGVEVTRSERADRKTRRVRQATQHFDVPILTVTGPGLPERQGAHIGLDRFLLDPVTPLRRLVH